MVNGVGDLVNHLSRYDRHIHKRYGHAKQRSYFVGRQFVIYRWEALHMGNVHIRISLDDVRMQCTVCAVPSSWGWWRPDLVGKVNRHPGGDACFAD